MNRCHGTTGLVSLRGLQPKSCHPTTVQKKEGPSVRDSNKFHLALSWDQDMQDTSAQKQCWAPAHVAQHFTVSKVLTPHPSMQQILTEHSSVPGVVLDPEARKSGHELDKSLFPYGADVPAGGRGVDSKHHA